MDERVFMLFSVAILNALRESSNFLYVGMHGALDKSLLRKHNEKMKLILSDYVSDCEEVFGEKYSDEGDNAVEVKDSEDSEELKKELLKGVIVGERQLDEEIRKISEKFENVMKNNSSQRGEDDNSSGDIKEKTSKKRIRIKSPKNNFEDSECETDSDRESRKVKVRKMKRRLSR